MVNPKHGKERPLYPTRLAVFIILGIAVILGVLIWWFLLRPLDATTTLGHVAPHVHPNTGKIIAKAPQIKAKVLTVAQLHAHHLRHVAYLAHEHALHVKHLLHIGHEVYVDHHTEER